MKNYIITLGIGLISCIALYPQDLSDNPQKWASFIHLESGFVYPTTRIKESIAIRQNISSYFVNQSTKGEISSNTSGFLLGLRLEYFNVKLKTGISTGLKYSGYQSEISGYSSSNADFFYLRYSMLDSDTKFARIKSLNETNKFLSIPLEFRYVPINVKGFGLFVKAGADFCILKLENNTDINFQDKSMEVNEGEILDNIGTSGKTSFSSIYGSVGMKFGYENKPNYTFEVLLPSKFLTSNNFTLFDVDNFYGFKFSVQFPVKL